MTKRKSFPSSTKEKDTPINSQKEEEKNNNNNKHQSPQKKKKKKNVTTINLFTSE